MWYSQLFSHTIEQVKYDEIFCREWTPTAVRVFDALTHHARVSNHKTEGLLDVCHEAVRQ